MNRTAYKIPYEYPALNDEQTGLVQVEACKRHGQTPHVTLFNEAGYNATTACMECLKEIRALFELGKLEIYPKEERNK